MKKEKIEKKKLEFAHKKHKKKIKEKPMKKYKLKTWVIILMFLLSLSLFAYSIYHLVIWIIDSKQVIDVINELEEETVTTVYVNDGENVEVVNPPEEKTGDYWEFIKMPFLSVDFNSLLSKNQDTVAYISIANTNINYPVVQTTDNSYYLDHAFDKSWNSAGWLFMDYRNDAVAWGKNTIIYGHSMINTTMFGTLYKTYKPAWYNNSSNLVIQMSTPTENTLWQIFSIYKTDAESYYITTSFTTDEQYLLFLDTIKGRSVKDFGVTLNNSDKVLTLSTCTSATGNGRLVVHAKLIKKETR